MDLLTIFAVAVALGTDAFSLSIGIGLSGVTRVRILLISGTVSVFHVLMPLIGLYLGDLLGHKIGQLAVVIGSVVLVFIGFQMILESIQESRAMSAVPAGHSLRLQAEREDKSWNSFWGLILLAGSVSLDALGVGFSLGALEANLVTTVLIMGIVAGLMTAAGLVFGKKVGGWIGSKAGYLGGIILIFIGLKLLF